MDLSESVFYNWQILHEVYFQRLVFKAHLALSILEIIGFPLWMGSKPTLTGRGRLDFHAYSDLRSTQSVMCR